MSRAICPLCNCEMFEYIDLITKETLFNCCYCRSTFELKLKSEVKNEK